MHRKTSIYFSIFSAFALENNICIILDPYFDIIVSKTNKVSIADVRLIIKKKLI